MRDRAVFLSPTTYPLGQLTGLRELGSLAFRFLPTATGSGDLAMKSKNERMLSRREFAQRAAVLSATASLVPSEVIVSKPQATPLSGAPQGAPKLTDAGQTEADSRYQQILSLFGERLDDAQKANIKRTCAELQPSLERIRSFKLENGDASALYLKPLVEREKQTPANSGAKAGTSPKKP